MKVLLLRPPPFIPFRGGQMVPPLGILYLASSLRGGGHEVEVMDCLGKGIGWRELMRRVGERTWDVIGFTVYSPTIESSRRAMNLLRPFCLYMVAGGPHATVMGEGIFDDLPLIDFSIRGEGEMILSGLLHSIERGEEGRGFPSILKKGATGGVSPFIERVEDLDSIPFPAYDMVDIGNYRYLPSPFLPVASMITSRGCPHSCLFCEKRVAGSTFRFRSPANILGEIDLLVRGQGVRSIVFYDDIFTHQRERVNQICHLLMERCPPFWWKCEARVDEVDRETLEVMKQAGCRVIGYGIESIKGKSLDFLRKGVTPGQIEDAVRWTKEAGIEVLAYLIAGIPGEEPEEFRESLDFCIRAGVDWLQVSTLSPLPGTPLYRLALKMGWLACTRARNPFDAEVMRLSTLSRGWDEAALSREMMRAYIRFYLLKGRVVRLMRGRSKVFDNIAGLL